MDLIRILGFLFKKIMEKNPNLKVHKKIQINLMGISDDDTIFLTQDEQELHMLQQLQT